MWLFSFFVAFSAHNLDARLDALSDKVSDEVSPPSINLQAQDVRSALAAKQGMNANGAVPRHILDQFTSASSWFWTYGLEPPPEPLAWGQANRKEFVPLVNLKSILPRWHPDFGCTFRENDGNPTCTVDMLVEVLDRTRASITTNYLMGYNEAYSNHNQDASHANKDRKACTPAEGADWWRRYVQPAAQRTGLQLVSPTTGISTQKRSWLVEFLSSCYGNRTASPPCNVELINTFSVHEYKCYENYWAKYAAVDGGDNIRRRERNCEDDFRPRNERNFYTALKADMRALYGDETATSFWDPYIDQAKLWVTETSCSGDRRFDRSTPDSRTPTRTESCLAITGQDCQHKRGSVAAMLDLPNIERISWFTLFPDPPTTHPNYDSIVTAALFNASTEAATSLGRAMLSGLDPTAARCSDE